MYKKWLKQRLNILRKVYFRILCFIQSGRSDSFEHTPVQSLFKSFFVHNLVRKIYAKMSKIWKNAKISRKHFFMNFRDTFMWVMVDENTSPGSVLGTTSWSESSFGKKDPSFSTPHKFTNFSIELLCFIRYFRTYGQQDISVDLIFHVITKPQSSSTQR